MNFLELLKQGKLIGAHRGSCKLAPENTLSAIKASVGRCDFIEVDVQLSSDGIAIVIHDDSLERTSNASGKVCDFTFKELSAFDYGSWFDGKYEALLSLNDTLKFIKENSLYLIIEIKDMHRHVDDEKVVDTIFKEIEKYYVQDLVMISSFRAEYLPLCKEKIPSIPTALLVWKNHPKRVVEYLKKLHVDAYNMNDKLVDSNIITKLTDAGIFVNVYGESTIKNSDKLFAMGIAGVFVDI